MSAARLHCCRRHIRTHRSKNPAEGVRRSHAAATMTAALWELSIYCRTGHSLVAGCWMSEGTERFHRMTYEQRGLSNLQTTGQDGCRTKVTLYHMTEQANS